MDSRKNRRMAKLFPCFRPDAAVDDGCEPVVSKGKIMHSDESSLSSSSDGDSSLDGGRRSKGSSRRRLSRAIKAVLFDTSLTRKIRERRSRKNTFRSNSSLSVKGDKIANDKSPSLEGSTDVDEMNRINSTRSSSIFSASTNASSLSSSCSSSRNANSLSSSERRGSSRDNSMEKGASFRVTNVPLERKESIRGSTKALVESPKQNIDYFYSSTIGACLLLTSLLVLVFWGKICAILCTSIWLFFGPRKIRGAVSAVSMPATVDVDSEQYKKRVIMEGLLKRNRSRAVAAQ